MVSAMRTCEHGHELSWSCSHIGTYNTRATAPNNHSRMYSAAMMLGREYGIQLGRPARSY